MDILFVFFIIMIVMAFFMILETFILLVVLMTTPAGTFLLAKIRKMPVIAVRHKDITFQFLAGWKRLGNLVEVKKKGFFEMQKGTGNFEIKSKVMLYDCISEQSNSQSIYKAALVRGLRQCGFVINEWKDLKKIMLAAGDKQWCREEYVRLQGISKKVAKAFVKLVKDIRNKRIEIFTATSYKISDLYNLFPNEMSPANVKEATTLAVQLDRQLRNKNLMIYAMAFFIICLAAGLAYVLFTSNSAPEVTVKITADMLQNATGALVG